MGSVSEDVPLAVALSPSDLNTVSGVVDSIKTKFNQWKDVDSTGDEVKTDVARHELLRQARMLVQSLETPRETMIKHCWAEGGVHAAIICGVDKGLWKLMAKNGDRPQTVQELADALDFDPALLSRLMRHLGAMGYIDEVGVDEYKPTKFSKSLSIGIIGDGYFPMLASGGPAAHEFVEFARKNGYKNPTDATNTSVMNAYNTKMDFFAYNESRGYGPQFNNHMGGYRQGRMPWMHPKFFPVQERLIKGADTENPDAPFLVDVGGNVGHDLAQFQQFHPNHPGKLIVQDLQVVLDQIQDLDPRIVRMTHNFFEKQTAQHARAYYMHSVLHDWPDDKCKEILDQLAKAMKPGYSKVLINENVIPLRDAYWESTALDMVMLTLCSAKERTLADWEKLVEGSGLKIVNVWTVGKGVESLIECELA